MKKKPLRNLPEVLRDEMTMRDSIVRSLEDGPKTVPELTEELGQPGREVMMWLMGMRRAGLVTEMPKARADDYFKYKLQEQDEQC